MQKLLLAEKTIPLIKHMLIPAFLFICFLLSFYLTAPYSDNINKSLHFLFYTFCFVGIIILLYFNLNKSLFFIISISIAYILINYLKNTEGETYIYSTTYQNICVFLPINLLFFYFWPNHRFLSINTIYLLLGLFIEFSLAEHLSRADISLGFTANLFGTLTFNVTSLILFCIFALCTFINSVRYGDIWNYNAFFAGLFTGLGLHYSTTAFGLTIFFLGAMICLVLSIAQNIYIETYYDFLTGLYSRNSFIIHVKNLPPKYSLGIISIDDYDKIANTFGKRTQNTLVKMITAKILEIEKEEAIYRYSPDEFVIIYKNLDKKETFNHIEEIRRAIASSLFEYTPNKKAVKLTISGAIAEKKRQDLNPFEVLIRGHKILQKARKFSHNFTSMS